MTVSVTVIGHDGRDELLEGFEDDHTLKDLRAYWQEHFDHIDWVKNIKEEERAVEIGKQEAVPWADVVKSTLGDLKIEVHKTLTLTSSHIVG
jgi:hypothetical protein